jgi:DNA repair exonuclease SbcCD ATPase subunit
MSRTIIALVLAASVAAADDIDLKSGGKLTGMIREENSDNVVIETVSGTVTIARKDVVSILKGPSIVHQYYDRLKTCVKADEYERLADWAVENKMNRVVKDLKAKAVELRRKEFQEALANLSGNASADEFYDLGAWAKKYGLEKEGRDLLERAIVKNPDHEMARRELGFKRFEGKWMTEEEVYLAKGFVKFEGQWITESQKELIVQERAAKFKEREKKIQDEERKLASERSKLDAREQELKQREATLKKELADVEAEEMKLKKIEQRALDREAFLLRLFGDPSQIQPCPTCKVWWSRANFQSCPFCAYKKDHK